MRVILFVKHLEMLIVIFLVVIGIGGLCVAFAEDRDISVGLRGVRRLEGLFVGRVQKDIKLFTVTFGFGSIIMLFGVMFAANITLL